MQQFYEPAGPADRPRPAGHPHQHRQGRGRPAARRLERRRARPHEAAASTAPPGSRAGPGQPGQGLSVFLPRGHDRRAAQRPGHRLAGRARPARWPPPRLRGPGCAAARQPPGQAQAAAGTRPRFLQRVFTKKPREWAARPPPSRSASTPAISPCASKASPTTARRPDITALRAHPPRPASPADPAGRRFINGERLPEPYTPDLYAGALSSDPNPGRQAGKRRPHRRRRRRQPRPGLGIREERIPTPAPPSPPSFYPDAGQPLGALELAEVQALLNAGKAEGDQIKLESATPRPDGQLDIERRRAPTKPACATRTHQPPLLPQRHLGQQGQPRPRHRLRHRRRPRARRLGQGVLRLPVRGGGLAVEGASR
jgi:hypothetical protein